MSGDFSLVGPKLRETLAWLAVDVSSMPANKLTQLSVKGRMGSRGGNVQVSDAVFELDDLKGAGGIVVSFTVPLSVVTHVELGTLDLDSYVPPPGPRPAAAASPVASVTPILALLGPSIGLKLKVAKIDYRGDAITGVDIDVARDAGTLRLNEVKVANLAGARIALRGAVASYWTPQPRADFAFDLEAPDIDRVLKLAGGAPAGLGALSLRGGVAGSWESLTLRDCALDAMGWSVLANGALALPGAARGHDQVGVVQGQHRRQRPADRGLDRRRPLGQQARHFRRSQDQHARFRPAGRRRRSHGAAAASAIRPPSNRSRSARRCAASTAR